MGEMAQTKREGRGHADQAAKLAKLKNKDGQSKRLPVFQSVHLPIFVTFLRHFSGFLSDFFGFMPGFSVLIKLILSMYH
jgi:hypothetical protein